MPKKVKTIGSPYGGESGYLERVLRGGPSLLEVFILQNKSMDGLEILAQAAHPDRPSLRTLEEGIAYSLSHLSNKEAGAWLEKCDPTVLRSIARIEANLKRHPDSLYTSVNLFKAILKLRNKRALTRNDQLIFLECLSELGFSRDFRKYRDLFLVSHWALGSNRLMSANLLNPNMSSSSSNALPNGTDPRRENVWLERVNAIFYDSGFEPIALGPGAGDPFDRIICNPISRVESGPLVTVMIPSFDADQRFETAIRSLVNQSWKNLQIVIFDDCTPGGVPEVIENWANRDSRIEIYRGEVNAGTYPARNFVLDKVARGEFFTVHDDDDWSHPRKIEAQVNHLISNPNCPANMSMLSRATPALKFTRINNNGDLVQRNYSSLMFRTKEIKEHIGFWGDVNRSGDAEFIDRIQCWSGEHIPGVGVAPLSFLRVREGSLTSGEIYRGYIDRRRRFYQLASRAWHSELAESPKKKQFYLPRQIPEDPAPFCTPYSMRGSKIKEEALEVDIVYATDFRFPGGNSSLAAAELDSLAFGGYKIAVCQLDSPLLHFKTPLNPKILEVLEKYRIPIVSLSDFVNTKTTLVRHPSVAELLAADTCNINTIGRVALIANHVAVEPDGKRSRYQPSNCLNRLQKIFGKLPTIYPESDVTRRSLAGLVNPRQVSPTNWGGVLSPRFNAPVHKAEPSRKPVIGRHGRDDVLKWPADRSSLLKAYPTDGSVDVAFLGGADHALTVLGVEEPPSSWVIHPYGSLDVPRFLADLDFWVFMHNEDHRESFGMAALEAMAAGIPVILEPYLESTFGDAALYATPDSVMDTVTRLWLEPEMYTLAAENAKRYAQTNFGADKLYARIESLF